MEKGKAEKKIQEYISKNGISQTFVADLLGLSPANLSATFKGRRRLKADELIIFCQHYGLREYLQNNHARILYNR